MSSFNIHRTPTDPPTPKKNVVIAVLGWGTGSGLYNIKNLPRYPYHRASYFNPPLPVAVWCQNKAQAQAVMSLSPTFREIQKKPHTPIDVINALKDTPLVVDFYKNHDHPYFFASLFSEHQWPTIYFAWPDAHTHGQYQYTKLTYSYRFIDSLLYVISKPRTEGKISLYRYRLCEDDDVVDISSVWEDSSESEPDEVSSIVSDLSSVTMGAASSSQRNGASSVAGSGAFTEEASTSGGGKATLWEPKRKEVPVIFSDARSLLELTPPPARIYACARKHTGELIAKYAKVPHTGVAAPSLGLWADSIADAFGWSPDVIQYLKTTFLKYAAMPHGTIPSPKYQFIENMVEYGMPYVEAELMWNAICQTDTQQLLSGKTQVRFATAD
ncbi:hypothetical protein K474DRAFT_1709299 [Panus rudis PR-1116 ss-1]|nr:hypothetical protein K474DRAFT_1709299 [Panus rudis PR-1116 ss-1]